MGTGSSQGSPFNFDASGNLYTTGPSGGGSVAGDLTTGQNALSTTEEQVIPANTARRFAEVTNADAAINVYLGKDNTVTAANGHLLKPGASFGFEGYSGAVWAIAASGTPTVTFIEW